MQISLAELEQFLQYAHINNAQGEAKMKTFFGCDIFEIPNTFTKDLNLNQQIKLGICDWQLDCPNGHSYFGRTECEVKENAQKGGF